MVESVRIRNTVPMKGVSESVSSAKTIGRTTKARMTIALKTNPTIKATLFRLMDPASNKASTIMYTALTLARIAPMPKV